MNNLKLAQVDYEKIICEETKELVKSIIHTNAHMMNRVLMLEDKIQKAHRHYLDTDILIQKWKVLNKGTLAYEDFYKSFKEVFPAEYKEKYGDLEMP